jgi:hypothetical protein
MGRKAAEPWFWIDAGVTAFIRFGRGHRPGEDFVRTDITPA